MVIALWILTLAYSVWAFWKHPTGWRLAFLPAVWLLGSDFSMELSFAVMLPILVELRPVPPNHPRRIGAFVSAIVLISIHGWEALLHSPRHTFAAALTLVLLGLFKTRRALRVALAIVAFWSMYFTILALLGH